MKTKIKRHSRSVISVLLAVCMLVSCLTVGIIATDAAKTTEESVGAVPTTVYFIPTADWRKDSARFKANFNKDNGSYTASFMTEIDSTNHVYSVTVPADKNKVQFLRWGPTTDDKQYNYSENFTMPTDGKNCLTLSTGWNNASGTWSTYDPTTPLGTPSITYNSSSANVTENAAYGSNARIEWTGITDAGSYNIYKGDSNTPSATGVTNTYYDIPKSAASNGTYKVTAVPAAADTSHTESAKSNGIQFTFNKTDLTTPTITISPTDITSGGNVTVNVTNYASFDSNVCTLKLYRSGSGTAVATLAAASSTVALPTTDTYYVKAEPKDAYEDYHNAKSSDTVSVTVNTPTYWLTGYTATGWGAKGDKFETYEGSNIYSLTETVNDIEDENDYKFFRLYDGSKQYRPSTSTGNGDDKDVTDFIDVDNKVGLTNSEQGAFKITENGTYTFFIDQTEKEFWVLDDYWRTSVVEYTQNYGDDGNYTTATESDAGGTASVTPAKVAKESTVTLTAAPETGYHFAGWYTNAACTTPAAGTTTALSQTYTPTANATLYALFQKDRFAVTVNAGANGTVASRSIYSGSTPVTLPAATPNAGHVFLNWTTESANLTLRNINSADGATVSATGTGAVTANFATAVTASAQVKGDGEGTVTVNGTANTKQVATGGEVTFTATPGANCAFYGWFTDAACTPANRVSTSMSFTTTVSENKTYYALINFTNHKLWGHGALVHWGGGKDDLGSSNITFSQSSSDSRIYTVTADMKRENYVAVSVYPGSPNSYVAATNGAGSGTAAAADREDYNQGTSDKWNPLGEYETPKSITFEWNAVTKELSWTREEIDPNKYTVVYVKELDDSNNVYIWSSDTKVFGNFPGPALNTFPEVTLEDGNKYRVIYLNSDSVGGRDTFSVNVNKGSEGTGTDFNDLEIGKSYTVARTGDGTTSTAVVTHEGLESHNLTVTVPKVNGEAVATATITSVNGVAQAAGTTSVTAYRGDDIKVTYVYNEGMEPKYDYDGVDGVDGETESSKVISFRMPNANTTAKVNFKEYIDTIYISDKANWGSIKLHIWNNNDGTTWDTWNSEPTMSKTADTWTALDYGEGHDVRYMYDADKELFLVRGLSQSKGSMANFIIRKSDGTARTANITDTEAGALYKTIGDSGDAHYKSASEFDYENYDPTAVTWPPDDSTSYSESTDTKLVLSDSDQFNTAGGHTVTNVAVTKNSGNTGYWVDLTDFVLTDHSSWGNIHFFLSSNTGTSGIQGNSNNYIVDAEDSSNKTKAGTSTINLPKTGTNLLHSEIKQNGSVHDTTTYASFNTIDRTKLTHVGVLMTPTDGKVEYKIYYTGSASGAKSKTVKVYAKDSTLRSGYTFYNKYATTNLTDSAYATATPKYYVGGTGTEYTVTQYADGGFHTYDYTPAVPKGSTIYFKTVMDDTDMAADSGASDGSSSARVDKFRTNYYLKGYSINGTVYQLHTGTGDEASGTYTESFTIPEDWAYDYVEITPIYWLKDTTDTMVFYVQGYTDEVRNAGWGNTIGVYPFYQDDHNVAAKGRQNAYGGYPGQPLVNYKGDLFAQIPVQYNGTNENNVKQTMYIKGVTMSNMFWDYVHLATGEVDKHHQTYDYDDLYKIYHEEIDDGGDHPDNIICSFKYENKHNNDEPASLTTTEAGLSVYSNGWEDLTNYAGDKVDIFGNVLTGSELTAEPLYVISQDYRDNCAGHYATEWAVYNNDGTKITTIVSSALILKDATKFDDYDAETLKYKDAYNTLHTDTYMGRPVKITYEQSIWGGSDQAERCDARWYYSRNGETINATIKIQTSEDNGRTWTDAEISDLGVASVGGETLTAVFDDGTYASASDLIHSDPTLTLNKEEYFYFTATQGTNYKFDSWQVERDGAIQEVTKKLGNDEEKAPRSGNAVFIARFKHVVSNKFSLYHEVHPQSAGVGTVLIEAEKHTSAVTKISEATDANKVASSELSGTSVTYDVANNETNVILATFTATPRADSTFDDFYETVTNVLTDKYGKKLDYVLDIQIDEEYNQFKILYDIDKFYKNASTMSVSSETFYSRFGFKERDYRIDYYFTTRNYGQKVYTVTGTITSTDAANNFKDQLATDVGFTSLNSAFVISKAPTESNFKQDMKWNSKDVVILPDEGTTLRAKLECTQQDYNVCRAKIIDGETTRVIETTFGNRFLINGAEYKASNPSGLKFWNVYKWKGGDHGDLVAQCYGSSFNYTAYEDYYVEAVYGAPEGYNRQTAYNSYQHGFISLDSVSRNHWNNNAVKDENEVWQINNEDGNTNGTTSYNKANTEYDRLYADFFIGYDYNGIDLSKNPSGYTMHYRIEKYVGDTLKSTTEMNVSKVDNKNRVHCTLGIGNTAENADYNTRFVITPVLKYNGTDVYNTNRNSIELKFYSIANADREWNE